MTEVFWYKKHDEMQKRIEELERENKRLKDYKEMWEELENKTFPKDYDKLGFALYNTQNYIRELKQRYLGGGE